MESFSNVLSFQLRDRVGRKLIRIFIGMFIFLLAIYFSVLNYELHTQVNAIMISAEKDLKIIYELSKSVKSNIRSVCSSLQCSEFLIVERGSERVLAAFPSEIVVGQFALVDSSLFQIVNGLFVSHHFDAIVLKTPGEAIDAYVSLRFWDIFKLPLGIMALFSAMAFGFWIAVRKGQSEAALLLANEIHHLVKKIETNQNHQDAFLTREAHKLYEIFERQKDRIVEYERNSAETTKQKEIANITKQVAHDIRSPLAALRMAISTANELPNDRRNLIVASCLRIENIANDLLAKSKKKPSVATAAVVEQALREIIEEKRFVISRNKLIQLRFEVSTINPNSLVWVDTVQLKRIVSNLINNSLDAVGNSGEINISLKGDSAWIVVEVVDNGCGIPENLLEKLGVMGVTSKKESHDSGHGLGLYAAKESIKSWGGHFDLKSQEGVGTTIRLSFKVA